MAAPFWAVWYGRFAIATGSSDVRNWIERLVPAGTAAFQAMRPYSLLATELS